MITEHAPLAPSSAPQWGFCTGSVAANRAAPDLVSERAREGTASHWVGEQVLNTWRKARTDVLLCSDLIGRAAPNGVVIDEEMAEGADVWVRDVLDVANRHGALQRIEVERRVHMPTVHADNWGTFDSAMWLAEADTLYVWDYKYGHREVNAVGNLQLIDYAIGLHHEISIHTNPDTRIVLRVVQPYCYHAPEQISEWVVSAAVLQGWAIHLAAKANEALTNPTMSAGLYCRDCAAITRCPTARRASYSVIDYANEPYQIETLKGPDLAVERAILTKGLVAVKARLGAIEDELQLQIQGGDTTSGLTVENKQGRLAWSVPVPQAIALGEQFGIDISKPGVVTPTQAIAAMPKEMRAAFTAVSQSATARPSTGMKLVALENSKTSRAFKRS